MILQKTVDLTSYKLIVDYIEDGFTDDWRYEVCFDCMGNPVWTDGNRFLREEIPLQELSVISEEIRSFDDEQLF